MRTVFAARQLSAFSAAGSVSFLDPVQTSRPRTTNEVRSQFRMPFAGTLRNLRARVTTNARTTQSVLRLRKNGADGLLNCAIPAAGTGIFIDSVNSDHVNAGDLICLSMTLGSGSGSLSMSFFQLEFEADDGNTRYFYCYVGNDAVGFSSETTAYSSLAGHGRSIIMGWTGSTDESGRTYFGAAAVASNLRCYVTANTYDVSGVITVMKNGVSTGLEVTISPGFTGQVLNALSSVTIAPGDYLSYRFSQTGRTVGSINIGHLELSFRDTGDDNWCFTVQQSENANPLVNTGETRYCHAAGSPMDYSAAPFDTGIILNENALAVRMDVTTGANFNGGSVAFQTNEADTSLSVDVLASGAHYSDTGSVLVSAGDNMGHRMSITFGNNSELAPNITMTFAPATVPETEVLVSKDELYLTGFTPDITGDVFAAADSGSLILAGYAPTVSISSNIPALKGELIFTEYTPSVRVGTVIAAAGKDSLVFTGYAPAIFTELAAFVSQQATLTLTVPPPPEVRASQQAILTAAKVVPDVDVSQFGSLTLGKVIPPIKVTQMANLFLVKPVIQPAVLPEPEIGGKETWTWLTDTLVSDDGTEQRIALRDHPRRSFSEKIIYDDYDLVTRHVQFMMDRLGQTFVLPLYHYRIKLTIHPVEGETSLHFDTSRMDIRPGSYVYLYDGELFQLCRVLHVFDDRAYVDLPVLYDFSDNVRVMPCAICTASNNTSFDRKNPDYYGSMTLNAEEVVVTPFIRDGNVQSLATYDDLPVLNKRPIGTDFDSAHDTGLERIDNGTGPVSLRNPWKHGQNTLNRRFIVHRRRPEDLDWWKRLADYAKGSQRPFLLPSGRQDFVIHTPAAPGGGRITVDGIKYGPSFFGHNAFRRVAISSAGGVHYATVWSATRDGDKNVLHFTPPYPTGPGWSQGQQVSFLLQVRIGDDKVELEHDRLHSFVDLNLRTVDDA